MLPPSIDLIQPIRAKPFHRDGWVYEEKYDGWRIVAFKDGHRVRLVSRTGRDHVERFSDVAAVVAPAPPHADSRRRVRVFDERLVSRFHLLTDPGDELDCCLRGRDLRARPLRDRRQALEDIWRATNIAMARAVSLQEPNRLAIVPFVLRACPGRRVAPTRP